MANRPRPVTTSTNKTVHGGLISAAAEDDPAKPSTGELGGAGGESMSKLSWVRWQAFLLYSATMAGR
jgi:hypothetical protein